MKKAIAVAIALAVLTGPVFAQKQQPEDEPMKLLDKEKKLEAQSVDRQYQSTIKRTGAGAAAPARVDPWMNMRGTTDSKASK